MSNDAHRLDGELTANDVWEATPELRFYQESSANMAFVVRTLQQKWRRYSDGKPEWRDVPTVNG